MRINKFLQITLLGICLTLSCIASSQTFWFNGGLTRSSLQIVYTSRFGNIDSVFQNPVNDISGSLEFEYAKKKKLSMASEVGIYKVGGSHTFQHTTETIKIPYLFAQQMFNWYPLSSKSFRLNLAIGPRVEYIVGKTDHPDSDLYFYDQLKVLNKFNFGATGKVGFIFVKEDLMVKLTLARPWKVLNFMSTQEGQDLTRSSSRSFNNSSIVDITGKDNVCFFNLALGFTLKNKKL